MKSAIEFQRNLSEKLHNLSKTHTTVSVFDNAGVLDYQVNVEATESNEVHRLMKLTTPKGTLYRFSINCVDFTNED